MTNRYTQRDARAAFERLARALGKRTGAAWQRRADGTVEPIIGVWILDAAPLYGGYRIEEITNHGGVRHPLGGLRLRAREFCYAVEFALDVLAEDQRRRGEIPESQGYPKAATP